MAEMLDQTGQGQLIVAGEAGPRRKKMINLLNRSPSPVILEDYGELEPSKCTVGGPGIAGGIVGVSTQVTVTARDATHVRIREGGHTFHLELKHTGKGSETRQYESVDHGDGHYSFSGVRADLKGMHQLSVEVNGTLVGDSPYLVMFEIDDDAELTTENADGTIPVSRKSAATSIKERIVFVQRMNPLMTPDGMFDIFSKFGRVMKCEKMLPAHDIWLLQFSRSEDAAESITVNGTEIMGCQVSVALASNLGGVGTHPIIMQQLQHIQAMHFQEQQSTSWATQLAAQRASIRQAGGEVEELTDTRKRRKALALMARLQAKVEQAKGSTGAGSMDEDGSPAGAGRGAPGGTNGADGSHDLRHRGQESRSKSRERERDSGREGRSRSEREDRGRSDRSRSDKDGRDRDQRPDGRDRERRTRDDESERRGRGRDGVGRGRDDYQDRRDSERRRDWERDGEKRDRDRRYDDREYGRERDRYPDHRGDHRGHHRSESGRRVDHASDRKGDDRRGSDRDKPHRRGSREREAAVRGGETHRSRDGRGGERSRGRDDDGHRRERRRDDSSKKERDRGEGPPAVPVRNDRGRSPADE